MYTHIAKTIAKDVGKHALIKGSSYGLVGSGIGAALYGGYAAARGNNDEYNYRQKMKQQRITSYGTSARTRGAYQRKTGPIRGGGASKRPIKKSRGRKRIKRKRMNKNKSQSGTNDTNTVSYATLKYRGTKTSKWWKKSTNSYSQIDILTQEVFGLLGRQEASKIRGSTKGGDEFTWAAPQFLAAVASLATHYYIAGSGDASINYTQSGYTNAKIFLEKIHMKLTFQNQGPTDVNITYYIVVAKRDRQAGELADPIKDWDTGTVQNAGNSGGSVLNYNTLGAKPTDSVTFNRNWRIKKKKTIVISGGGTHVLNMNVKYNKIRNVENLYELDVEQGYSGKIFWVQSGGLGDDVGYPVPASVPLNAAVKITTGPTKVIATFERRTTMRALSLFPNKQVFNSNLALTPANIFQMNEGTEAPLTMATAGVTNTAVFA